MRKAHAAFCEEVKNHKTTLAGSFKLTDGEKQLILGNTAYSVFSVTTQNIIWRKSLTPPSYAIVSFPPNRKKISSRKSAL